MIYDNVLKLMNESLDPYNKDGFRMILVVSMALLQIDEEECARFFDISRSTVERWIWGETAPGAAIRIPICNELKERIKKAGEELENTTESFQSSEHDGIKDFIDLCKEREN